MTLDSRARRAARAIQDSVVLVTPTALPVAGRRRRLAAVAAFAGAVAIAFAAIGLAAMLPDSPADDLSALVASTIPDPELPDGVALPDGTTPSVVQTTAVPSGPVPFTEFAGVAEPGTLVTAYSPYGTASILVGESSEFSLMLAFEGAPPGTTFPITIAIGEREYGFSFTPAMPVIEPESRETSAYQAFGVNYSDTPFEQFFGSAPPGTPVSVTSPYGSGETEATEDGQWYLNLWFEGAPLDEPFEVVVTVGGETFTFTFMWSSEVVIVEPSFSITQKNSTSSAAEPYSRFYGYAAPGTSVLAASEYGLADIVVGESGEFDFKVWFTNAPLDEKFPITISVDGVYYTTYYFKYFEPGPVELVVNQYNTESWDSNPWVKFYGTAEPGTVVMATSEYGSADVEAGSDGTFYLRLYFEVLPPTGVEFPVTVYVNGDEYGTYPFTSWFDPTNVELAVYQYNAESWDSNPWVKFYGTAPTGTVIGIVSDYGSQEFVVGADLAAAETEPGSSGGEFYFKMYFSTLPPAGVEFPVTVYVNGEEYGTYPFTSWYDPTYTEFEINQYNNESWDTEPWVKFFGTAPIGTVIGIVSDYGSTEITVGADARAESGTGSSGTDFLVRLYFSPLPPPGVEFPVTVYVNGEAYATYSFISWFDPNNVELSVVPIVVSSEDPDPYAKVEYSAVAGTIIELTSEYGSVAYSVGTSGGGHLKLVFSELPPAGVPFIVTILVDGSEYGSFEFVSNYVPTP